MNVAFNEATRERILQAAGEIFAEKGFRDATVREICARADVNLASVNYHFRSKEALYYQALSFAFQQAEAMYPLEHPDGERASPTDRLRWFIRHFLFRMLDDTHLGWHGKLITREMLVPSSAREPLIESAIQPRLDALRAILRLLARRRLERHELDRCVLSVVGQCLVYRHARAVIERLYPDVIAGPGAREASAEHVFRFTMAALRDATFDEPAG